MKLADMLATGPTLLPGSMGYANPVPKWRVLDIVRSRPMCQKDIVHCSDLSRSYVNSILNRLEKDGHITKVKAVVPPNTMGAIPWVWIPTTLKDSA